AQAGKRRCFRSTRLSLLSKALREAPLSHIVGNRDFVDDDRENSTNLSRRGKYHGTMQLRTLGNSDLQITPLGVGAWAMGGGGWAFGWGPQDDADSVAAVHAALDEGWNWIDTAAVYGLGHAETV